MHSTAEIESADLVVPYVGVNGVVTLYDYAYEDGEHLFRRIGGPSLGCDRIVIHNVLEMTRDPIAFIKRSVEEALNV